MNNRILASGAGLLLAIFSFAGCGEPKPEGLPTLYPALITILQDGKPLDGATVTLIPEDTSLSRWPVGGDTDTSGVAKLHTFHRYEGAPAGKFKVTVNKTITTGDPKPVHPGENATFEQLQAYDKAMKTGKFEVFKVVAPKFRIVNTTTLEVDISATGDNSKTLDVEAAVKEKDAAASRAGGKGDDTNRQMGN